MKETEEISFSGPRPGVSMITDKSVRTVVTLILAVATLNDSGSYTCFPNHSMAMFPLANITVNVLEGDKTAQLSRQFRAESLGPGLIIVILIILFGNYIL